MKQGTQNSFSGKVLSAICNKTTVIKKKGHWLVVNMNPILQVA